MDRKQLSMFKEWFADAFPDCKDYLELTYFDAEQNTFLSKCSYNPNSGNAAKVLRTVLGSWQHQQAKMEELQVQLKGAQERAQLVLQYKDRYRLERDELQKRVDKAIRFLVEAELYQSEPNIDLAVKALKGEGK
ncbi:hypothetical protein WDA44_01810 [Acinetobacter nosocomialis]|uniref:hypothetical protein n=1 Tax=Acinetobacter nosocomialis TaxID=106654 RepID=UPI00374E5731